jgi:hypothetical protein
MTTPEQLALYVKQAVPHESGHILVGRHVGLKISGLDHIVIRGPNNEILPGNFATVAATPRDKAAVLATPRPVLEAYAIFVAGGLAGNLIAEIPPDDYGLHKDRADLALVSTTPLEDVAKLAIPMIKKNMGMFLKLREAIQSSYDKLTKDQNIAQGRYSLLTNDHLEAMCPQNKTRFPMFFP